MKDRTWIALNTIYEENCFNTFTRMPDNYLDLTVTSPPYNLGIPYDIYVDSRPYKEYFAWTEYWLREIFRVTKPDGRVCINHCLSATIDGRRCSPIARIIALAEKIGFAYHGLAVWTDRSTRTFTAWGSWMSARAPYINMPYEGIIILYKKHWQKNKTGVTNISQKEFVSGCSGIWNLPTQKRKGHPAPFPEALASRCIQLFSYEGDIVYDPFMGSGTTAVVAKKLNRNFIGSEISKTYCREAQERLRKL